jgi:ABC-type dipeptide/oligopeptide/nickel transport system permease subunit
MILLLSSLLALHVEPPLRARLAAFRRSPAWLSETLMGSKPSSRLRRWAPWGLAQLAPLFPSAWLGALWGEATLSALGLGPGPTHDSLGRILSEELPRLTVDPTPLGWAALGTVLALAWTSTLSEEPA